MKVVSSRTIRGLAGFEIPAIVLCLLAALVAPLFAQSGGLDADFIPNVIGLPGVSTGTVYATAVQPDGKIIIGGSFSSVEVDGVVTTRANVARLNAADGSVDSTFNPNVSDTVYSIAVQADGKILLGGVFTTLQPNGAASATARSRIARVNADGTLDAGFDPKADSYVLSLTVQADGKILIGGGFTSLQPNGAASATARNMVARIEADGSVDASFNPGAGVQAAVLPVCNCLAVDANGKILIGGYFTGVDGQAHSNIARLQANGSVDAAFNPGANGIVYSLAVQADEKILLGGSFTSVNGQTRNRIARLDANGILDAAFNPDADWDVYGVAVQANGKLLLSGSFYTVGGPLQVHSGIARLNDTGTVDTAFSPSVEWEVNGVALQADGKIVLGGPFSTVNGAARNALARLNDVASQSVVIPNSGQVQWLRGGAGPEVSPVTFELSTNGGTTWSVLGRGTRIAGGWQLAGLTLPSGGSIRARGRTSGGYYGGSSGLVEKVQAFSGIPVLTPIENWRQTYFGSPANSGSGADTATPDHDGIPNLLKYTLVITPGSSGAAAMPYARRRTYAEGDRLAIIFTRDPARNDITINVEVADSPGGPWTQVLASSVNGAAMAGPGVVGETDAGGGRKTVEVRDIVNLSGTPRRFLHIRVVH